MVDVMRLELPEPMCACLWCVYAQGPFTETSLPQVIMTVLEYYKGTEFIAQYILS